MGESGPEPVESTRALGGGRVVLFAVPGAFTPGCSNTHLPGFVMKADELRERGVETIACTAVNDAFVMDAWQRDQNAEAITMLADGNADFASAMGMIFDASGMGLGTRSKRYALIAEGGVIRWLGVDAGGGVDKSSAESVLAALDELGR
ncbi:MAG: peroxiredoxin [Thiohalospira sp.]